MKKVFVLLLCLLCAACASSQPDRLTQINTIDSLLAGVYDGEVSLNQLGQWGNLGIGTFDKLDGEMLLLDGVFYQIKGDGRVYVPEGNTTTPFASVLFFTPQKVYNAQQQDLAAFCQRLDELVANPNLPIAVILEGEFAFMHTRSVPAQEKPYRPLVEVTADQAEFYMENIKGVVAGFRLPAYFKGINVPGYHVHFVSQDRQQGGHVLGFALNQGKVQVSEIYNFQMLLPRHSTGFNKADLGRDREAELHQAESAR